MGKKVNSRFFLVLLLGVLSAFGPFVIDLYLPSLPNLAQFFNTHPSMSQLTLTAGMLGLAFGQLLFGPVSDKFGRRLPLLISLGVFIVSTVLILFSPNIHSMIALRVVQGLASSGSVVISRAIVADLYSGREMTRFFGTLTTINGLAPIASPILGSLMLKYTDWRGMFVFLAFIGVAVMLFTFRLRESLQPQQRVQTSLLSSFKFLFLILKNKKFVTYVLISSFAFAGMFAYISGSPFIFQQHYGLSSVAFGLCFAANGAAFIAGSSLGGRLSNGAAVKSGVLGMLLCAFYVAAVLVLKANVWLIEVGFFLLLLSIGLMLPALAALAMDAERQYAGSASAMIGFMTFLFGALVSPLVGIGDIFYATATVIFLSALLTLVCYFPIAKGLREIK
ncbi:DHA1 family bicyclomycin/chloramphenicol resistance-like MFS transporter [Mesocricetibacter intestinalis]|uniref:Bcr/CflA family efflux transporter n=1 Tax=Mesocricetibacter intestinalis TaxID=1521930 RepID=A0A4R6V6X1_9PAST|nr:multidrug effflux MFS transporter [Mesocricetibacter intestinalis]TDQ56673.1 DHA1 family bicyclomycin/chloramphenicol resistance-like MFS transporter [Mesocricetibacter intestinalis]